jgi:hypothetical protein
VPLFHRRDETLNEKMLREAGYTSEGVPLGEAPADEAEAVEAGAADGKISFLLDDPDLPGTAYDFVTLADGSTVVDESAPDISEIADAVEQDLEPPYRVSAVKQRDGYWLVIARPITVEQLALEGDEVVLSSLDGVTSFRVDGADADVARVPARLLRLGEEDGADFVVRATRIDGDLWDVRSDEL